MLSGIPGNGSGRDFNNGQVGKPNQDKKRLFDPFKLYGWSRKEQLEAARGIIADSADIFKSDSIVNLTTLLHQIDVAISMIFPEAGSLLLVKRNGEYFPVSARGIEFNPEDLHPEAENSLVKVAVGEKMDERRTIYLPDLNHDDLWISYEFGKNDYPLDESSLKESGLNIDLFSLERCKIVAVAASPIIDHNQDPVGVLMLFGKKPFLDVYVDLIVLRELADSIASPLKQKTTNI